MSIAESFDEDAFFPDNDPGDWVSPEDHARVVARKDEYLRGMVVYASDMDDGGRALFAVIERFGAQMQSYERAQLLEIHSRLVFPEATFHEDLARLTETLDANFLVDISNGDTGEIITERVLLIAAIPDDRHERTRIRHDIDRDGYAMAGGGATPNWRLTPVIWRTPVLRGVA